MSACFCGQPAGATGLCHQHQEAERIATLEIDLYALDDEYAHRGSRRPPAVIHVPHFDGNGTKYGIAALKGIVSDILAAADGRNATLNRCAYRAATLVAGGQIAAPLAVDECVRAGLATGLPLREVEGTVRGAFRAGLQHPFTPARRTA